MKCYYDSEPATSEILFSDGTRHYLCSSPLCREDAAAAGMILRDAVGGKRISKLHAEMTDANNRHQETTMKNASITPGSEISRLGQLAAAYEEAHDLPQRGYIYASQPSCPASTKWVFGKDVQFSGKDGATNALTYMRGICREYGIEV